MLRLLDRAPHGERLRDLLRRFRAEQLSLTAALVDTESQIAALHRAAVAASDETRLEACRRLRHCRDLHAEGEVIRTELAHVRMAIDGAREELDLHTPRGVAPGLGDRLVTSA